MARLQIPIDTTQPFHQFFLDLEQVVYQFTFKENQRSGRWTFDMGLEDGTPIVQGIPIVVMSSLIEQHKDSRLPPGEIWCVDLTGQNIEPVTGSFGSTHLLIYEESGTDV